LPVAPWAMLRVDGEADRENPGAGAMVSAIAVLLTSVPDVPVMVTVGAAATAVLAAVKVTVLVRLAVTEPNVAVTPAGSPEAVKSTAALKPFAALMAMVLEPLAPGVRLKLAGVAESVKLAGAATVSATVALLIVAPDVPMTVRAKVPGAALVAAVSVKVLVLAADAGLNAAVTPLGRPLTEKETVPLNVPCGVTVMALVPLAPGKRLRLAGDAVMVYGIAAFSVKLIVVVLNSVPDVPVMLTMEVPIAAELLAARVNVLVPAMLCGPNVAVTPGGRPEAVNTTAPANPPSGVMMRMLRLELP
jgi:hypothetical protein